MKVEVVPLHDAHLDQLHLPKGLDRRSYFSDGSIALCVLADGLPVFAGGIVNLQWNRGEAWILPTPWFRSHLLTCMRAMKTLLPMMAFDHGFQRVQATCVEGSSGSLFRHLGFTFEGTLAAFGPNGEPCDMHSRIFDVPMRMVAP